MIKPLAEVFGQVADPRKKKGKRYELGTLLTLIFLAILSGEDGLKGIARWLEEQRWELAKQFGIKGGRMPSYGTIRRILLQIDIKELETRLSEWAEEMSLARQVGPWAGVALDGKTVRGSKVDEDSPAVHLLSAFSHQLAIVLGQQAVDGKTNEIPEARTLLETLTLEGLLITMDAMHTQRETAELITEKGGPI
jgi:hypothetical protein